jgi:hypothetical protein
MSATTTQLKPFVEAIGELCTEWAHLEQWVGRLFLAVGEWDYRYRNAILMTNCLDLRDLITATKIGAINKIPAGDLLEATIASLDYINNQLRTTRNGFIHHIWAAAEDGVGAMEVNITPKPLRQPGSGERDVQHWENRYVTLEEVKEVIDDITKEREYLGKIVQFVLNPQDILPPSLLAAQPARPHLLRRKERQRRKGT